MCAASLLPAVPHSCCSAFPAAPFLLNSCPTSLPRRWMPIFVYGFAVTSLAAALLTLAGVLVEGSKVWAAGPKGTFGYVADTRYLPKIVYLGIVPGILGHQGGQWAAGKAGWRTRLSVSCIART